MPKIYWNNRQIPWPEGAYGNRNDGRVFIMYRDDDNTRRRVTIGHATSIEKRLMHPNEMFRERFPNLWNEHYGPDQEKDVLLKVGLYAALLQIGCSTGIYESLLEHFGPVKANALMDYAQYLIKAQSNSTVNMQNALNEHMLFSKKLFSDSYYSDLFRKGISLEDLNNFRIDWLTKSCSKGTKEVWLSIDGTNSDCSAKQSTLTQQGKAKSNRNVEVVSYMIAIDANTKRPVTWTVNPGNMVDSKAIKEMVGMLKDSNIKVKGVILDRGFCDQATVDLISSLGYEFVLMLKSNCSGYSQLLQKHANTIRWNTKYALTENAIFGTVGKAKLFENSTKSSTIGIYYDGVNGNARSVCALGFVIKGMRKLQQELAERPFNFTIPPELKNYIVLTNEDGKVALNYNHEAWQKSLNNKGFFGIATSLNTDDALLIFELYQLRDISEKIYAIIKSQLGYDTFRVHSDEGIESKIAVAFIAAVLRTEIQLKASELDLNTNEIIQGLDQAKIKSFRGTHYQYFHNITKSMNEFLLSLGITKSHFEYLSEDAHERLISPVQNLERGFPEIKVEVKPKVGRPRKVVSATSDEPKKIGRPKGSKNKKTLALEAWYKEHPEDIPTKHPRPGRPKGSKNKKTLEREQNN